MRVPSWKYTFFSQRFSVSTWWRERPRFVILRVTCVIDFFKQLRTWQKRCKTTSVDLWASFCWRHCLILSHWQTSFLTERTMRTTNQPRKLKQRVKESELSKILRLWALMLTEIFCKTKNKKKRSFSTYLWTPCNLPQKCAWTSKRCIVPCRLGHAYWGHQQKRPPVHQLTRLFRFVCSVPAKRNLKTERRYFICRTLNFSAFIQKVQIAGTK